MSSTVMICPAKPQYSKAGAIFPVTDRRSLLYHESRPIWIHRAFRAGPFLAEGSKLWLVCLDLLAIWKSILGTAWIF